MIVLRDFRKSFNNHPVLSIQYQSFEPGLYWIRGENGSGKSTLFKCIAGLLPFEGTIAFDDGPDLQKNPVEFRKRLTYSEAEPLFPGFLTGRDLMRFAGKIRSVPVTEQDEYCRKLDVSMHMDKPCEACSSGMLKKISLAMALSGQPELIVLDEPFITLDSATRQTLSSLLSEKTKSGAIALVSSHEPLDELGIRDFTTLNIYQKQLI